MEHQTVAEMKRNSYRSEPVNSTVVNRNDRSANEPMPIVRLPRKKPYKPPIVTEYGNVARLTAGANGSHFDPGHNTGTKQGFG
jgi:hypothetical protein